MKARLSNLIGVLILLSTLLANGMNLASAQDAARPQPPKPPYDEQFPDQPPGMGDELRKQFPPGARPGKIPSYLFQSAELQSPQAISVWDDYGYTWDGSVAFNWIDAKTLGSASGLTGDDKYLGPIDIGFDFKFYENTYSKLYFNTNGFVSLGGYSSENFHMPIPNPASPNNIIAPLWTDLAVGSPYNNGQIYTYPGGTAPNRFFVIEWYNVTRCCEYGDPDTKTFEVILRENGDIDMQYQSLGENVSYNTIGIEDSSGYVGLQYLYNSSGLSNNKIVRYLRPTSPQARVYLFPNYFGGFARLNGSASLRIPLLNAGDLGSDTYDFTITSAWPVTLFKNDGLTPLADTDGDSKLDTGPVSQGATVTIIAKVQAPGGSQVGDANSGTLTAASSINPAKTRTVTLQSAIPTALAQAFIDDYDGISSLYLIQPGAQQVKRASGLDNMGYNPSVAETPDGNFAYAWSKGRYLDAGGTIYTIEIEYALTNAYGEILKPVSRLVDHSAATTYIYDNAPTVAVAGDGKIGIVWGQTLYRYTSVWEANYNVFFALLNPTGTLAYGPLNLTNNAEWTGTTGAPRFYDHKISASSNSFTIAWQQNRYFSGCGTNDCDLNDIYYTIRSTNGSQVCGVTKITNDTTSNIYETYTSPSLAALNGNRVLLLWRRYSDSDIYYAVVDNAGNLVKTATNLSSDAIYDYGSADAAQLSGGNIAVAWSAWDNEKYRNRFTILDATYNRILSPVFLGNPASVMGDYYVSVAGDQSGRAVLTWMDAEDSYRRNLYYALVNSSGGVITQPMIFRTAQDAYPNAGYIQTSFAGYGNTTYSSPISTSADGALLMSSDPVGGAPGGSAAIYVKYSNHGQATASGVSLVMTLPTGLSYLSDTSGTTPTVGAHTVTWNLPDVSFLEEQGFMVYLGISSSAHYGTIFPVNFELHVNLDSNLLNNYFTSHVMVSRQIYLPFILK